MKAFFYESDENGHHFYKEIPSRNCSNEDFGINGIRNDIRFYNLLPQEKKITQK